jgi:hypothetical protein
MKKQLIVSVILVMLCAVVALVAEEISNTGPRTTKGLVAVPVQQASPALQPVGVFDNVSAREHDKAELEKRRVIEEHERERGGSLDTTSQPDPFGYRFRDNQDGDTTVYSWIEIAGTGGTRITFVPGYPGDPADDGVYSLSLPFIFPFYGVNRTTVTVVTNGNMQFTTQSFTSYSGPLPIAACGAAMFPYLDDLHTSQNGANGVWYQHFGDHTVIEWDSACHYNAPGTNKKFEVILFQNGKIKMQYAQMRGTINCTIGIQAAGSGTNFRQYQYAGNPPHTVPALGRAVWFYAQTAAAHDFSVIAIVSPSSTHYDPGSSVSVTATVMNRGTTTEAGTVYYRFNGGDIVSEPTAVLAQNGTENHTFTAPITLPMIDGYYPLDAWATVAGDADHSNDTAHVNVLVRNCLPPLPLTENFDQVILPNFDPCWAVQDIAHGYTTWTTYNFYPHSAPNHAWLGYAQAHNSWLFTRGLPLTSGVTYRLSYWFRAASYNGSETWEVKYGAAQNASAMIYPLLPITNFSNETYHHTVLTFTPATTGVYYIGWHGMSANAYGIGLDDVSVDALPAESRCCYNDPNNPPHKLCVDDLQADCSALGGTWSLGYSCPTDPCPEPCPYPSLDVEPNNTCSAAQNVACGDSLCGAISVGSDVDWYRIVVPQGQCQTWIIKCFADDTPGLWPYGQELNPHLYFYGSNCTTLLAENDDNYGTYPEPEGWDSRLGTGCIAAGTYYIKVGHWGATGPYVLVTQCTACQCALPCNQYVLCGSPAEVEPNNTCPSPTQQTIIECDTTVYGLICPVTDHDFWKVIVPPLSKMTLTQSDGVNCATTPTSCIQSRTYNSSCQLWNGPSQNPWVLVNNGFAPWMIYLDVYSTGACTGTYQLSAVCCPMYNAADHIIAIGATHDYTATVNTCVTDPCGVAEVVSEVPAFNCSGGHYASGPCVIFSFQLQQHAANVMISDVGAAGSDEQLLVFTDFTNPLGTCVASSDTGAWGPTGEAVGPLSLGAGTYYISVSMYYSLSPTCGDITLHVTSDVVLPVTLLSFEGVPGDNSVNLLWTTASENGLDRFEIERDGTSIVHVAARNSATGSSYQWTDASAQNGTTYHYALVVVSVSGNREVLGQVSATPNAAAAVITEYALRQNYPNPFNPITNITVDLLEDGFASLKVYNLMGQEVATLINRKLDQGRHIVSFDASNLPSGVYVCRLGVNGFVAEKKMLLMK